MVRFYFHLRTEEIVEVDEIGLECRDVHGAYLEACRAIPDLAAQFLTLGRDPIGFRFEIAAEDGVTLMKVPFDELLRPAVPMRAGRFQVRSRRAAIAAAQKFKPVLEDAPFGAVIMTPDMQYVSVNRAITRLTGETDETTHGLFLEEEAIVSRDPGNTVTRAAASMKVVRTAGRHVEDRRMFWGTMPGSIKRPALTISYWPMMDDGELVALGVRVEPSRRPASH